MKLVTVNSARRNDDGSILCSLDVQGTTYLTTFHIRGGDLCCNRSFWRVLHASGLTMAHIEGDVYAALRGNVDLCPLTEDDLYDTEEAIEQRAWDKWYEAARHEPRCLYC